ncbi:MAG: Gmad2 immunoglobulin-like domain-containing protein [Patescibacteria group bacterium]
MKRILGFTIPFLIVGAVAFFAVQWFLLRNVQIQVYIPKPSSFITSPLFVIEGRARGNWFFEASFPVKLLDGNGKLISSGIAQVDPPGENWMTNNFVPFHATLLYNGFSNTESGTLVLKRDNPSGLPQNDDEIRIPVFFR